MDDFYLTMFLDETKEQLEKIEQNLLLIEEGNMDDEIINNIFRMAHSIKSTAATIEFDEMSEVAHSFENLLDKVRNKQIVIEQDVMDLFFRLWDILKGMHSCIREGKQFEIDNKEIINFVQQFIDKKVPKDLCKKKKCYKRQERDEEINPGLLELTEEEILLCQNIQSNLKVYKIKVIWDKDAQMISVKVFLMIKNLIKISDIITTNPREYEDLSDEKFNGIFETIIATEREYEVICKNINLISDIKKVYINEVIKERDKKNISNNEEIIDLTHNAKKEEITTVRVNVDKIDKLLNMVGEFIIDKESLNQLGMEFKRKYKNEPLMNKFINLLPHISYVGLELQEIVMSMRMLPMENIFNRFPRMVRDLSKKCNKDIKFVVEGKETEVDRGIIEELVDPLTHIIRNSIDHGFGTKKERTNNNKNDKGTLRLSARHAENHLVIEVEDDGKGIDVDEIKRKVIEKGLCNKEKLKLMSNNDIINFIFEPGFSTSTEVTDISGRGVGLDVVKTNIGKLNGIIDIKTELGKGTKFIIKLPLTLAIIQALIIKERQYNFAIPITSIIETIRLKEKEIKQKIHNSGEIEVFQWRDGVIPVLRIGEYFGINSDRNKDKLFLVIVGYAEKKVAVVVDKFIGEQEIVIKSMTDFIGKDKLFGDIKGISGVSISPDGSFTQVIDVGVII